MAKKIALILSTIYFSTFWTMPIKGADNQSEQKEVYYPSSALCKATQNEDLNAIKILIKEHPQDLNKEDAFGKTPLHIAAEEGYTAIFKELVQNGADIETKNRFHERPIHKACLNKNIEILKLLLTYHADIGAKNFEGQTALHIASSFGFLQGVALLLAYNAPINKKNSYGQTSLHMAIEEPDNLIIHTLISDKKIDLEATNNKGETALHIATKNNNLNAIKLLLAYGADITKRDFWGLGKTAEEIALKNGFAPIALYFDLLSKCDGTIKGNVPFETFAEKYLDDSENGFNNTKSLLQYDNTGNFTQKFSIWYNKKIVSPTVPGSQNR